MKFAVDPGKARVHAAGITFAILAAKGVENRDAATSQNRFLAFTSRLLTELATWWPSTRSASRKVRPPLNREQAVGQHRALHVAFGRYGDTMTFALATHDITGALRACDVKGEGERRKLALLEETHEPP